MLSRIQNTQFYKRSVSINDRIRIIQVFAEGEELLCEVHQIDEKQPVIEFEGDKRNADFARQMANALQLAATIANDFDTWFDEE